jgi:hypothetical protein
VQKESTSNFKRAVLRKRLQRFGMNLGTQKGGGGNKILRLSEGKRTMVNGREMNFDSDNKEGTKTGKKRVHYCRSASKRLDGLCHCLDIQASD